MEKVLIVDDEPRVLESLKMHLGRNYSVITTSEPAEALKALSRHTFAVIISDLKMPEMSGVELLTRARAISPRTTRVLLTGYASLQSAIEAINSGGVYRLLTKPSTPPEVRGVVDAAVQEYHVSNDQGLVDRHIEAVKKIAQAEELGRELADMAFQFSAVVYAATDEKIKDGELEDLRWVEDKLHENAKRLNDGVAPTEWSRGVDMGKVIQAQIELWKRSGRLDEIRLRTSLDMDAHVLARERLIERGFIVLMENAIEAVKEQQKPRISVKLYFCEFMEMVCLEIKDNGPAISPEVAQRLLKGAIPGERRGESLYLLNQAIENVGGSMGFRQSQTGGAVFSIWLKRGARSSSSLMYQPTESFPVDQ